MGYNNPYAYQDATHRNEKLDPDVKAEWVKALLSGSYKQTKGRLCKIRRNGDKAFCCLGVMSDIYKDSHIDESNHGIQWKVASFNGETYVDFVTPNTSRDTMPPNEVIEFAYGRPGYGISEPWTVYLDEKDARRFIKTEDLSYRNYVSLADLNDRGFPFKSIAYLIEKYL